MSLTRPGTALEAFAKAAAAGHKPARAGPAGHYEGN